MKKIVFIMFLAAVLAACGPASIPAPTATPVPTATFTPVSPTFTPIVMDISPSPIPTQPPPPIFTPDAIQVERWKEYQTELAKVLLFGYSPALGYDPDLYKSALCEWDILGRSDQEVYVWAFCATLGGGENGSFPTVIYLEVDGSIRNVSVAGYKGSSFNLELFPADVREKSGLYIGDSLFNGRIKEMINHIDYRKTHPEELPLSVLSATPIITAILPTPLPTQPTIPVITPDAIQVERWEEYQTALAKTFFPSSFIPGQFLCEWEILGRSDQEVYVWAVCMSTFSIEGIGVPYEGDMPAVLHIKSDGIVQSVEVPGGGSSYASDIRRMFPLDAQERYFGKLIPFQELIDHLSWRREHTKELPLIVLSAIPTATPTP